MSDIISILPKFGRLGRTYNPAVPHLSALMTSLTAPLPPPPASVNYTVNMPTILGMMRNDKLGDCTCAAYYHARQVWTINAQQNMVTEPDIDVENLYIDACGYDPQQPGEGPGGNEQAVLTYLLNSGAPIGSDGQQREKILAFVEVDPRIIDDVKRTINWCGVAYIGFVVPTNIKDPNNHAWDYDPQATIMINDDGSQAGHAVVLAGYDDLGATVISWGEFYTMTWSFFSHYVDEAYGIVDPAWVENGGGTPAGLTLNQLKEQMAAL